ncbi:hypothetical protein [Actinocrispum wychmicini]|uniref:Uncharacterized protein n=1 Tax=Actinocrispum wychmicini TaxID=1213861 RepID=A0A4R2J7D6_9PSEU|nr:hypothetical protein [Actinocrispum wychmicini]TCO52506.1 hypothetical protein EV192_112238 [Actinocrispum wychmicini]
MTAREFAESTADTDQQSDTVRRGGPVRSITDVLALQGSAGNHAVARMLTVQREPAGDANSSSPPTLDGRALGVTVEPQLRAEREKLLAEYQPTTQRWQELKTAAIAKEITPEGAAELADLEKEQKRLGALLDQNDKDMRLLSAPGASDQALNEMLARRNQNVSLGRTTDTTTGGWQIGTNGLTSTNTAVTSRIDDGASWTTTNTSTTTVDTTGVANRKTEVTTNKEGESTSAWTTTSDRKVDVSGGNVNYNWGTSNKAEYKGADNSTSEMTGTSRSLGTSGYSTTAENTTTNGGTVDSTKSTSSVTRGDGKLGYTASTTKKSGTQDDRGGLTKGTENTTSGSGGVIAGPDGVGVFGSGNRSFSQSRESGLKTGQTVGLDGKVVTNVSQVPGSDPARYQISVTVNLTGKVGGSAGGEQASEDQGGKASVGATASGSAAMTGTFVHVFTEAEAQQYLAAVNSKGAGSGPKELQIVELLAKGKISGARALLNDVRATWLSADGAAAMKDSDSGEVTADLKGELGATAGGDMSGFGGKLNVSVTKGRTLKRSVSRKGGKVVVTVSVTDTDGGAIGGSASFEAAGGGYQSSSSGTKSQSVTFTLDPETAAYQQQFDLIAKAGSVEELHHIALVHADLVSADTTSEGYAKTGTTTATVGPVGLELSDTSSFDHSRSSDANGSSDTYTGSKGGGAAITGPGGFKVAHTEKDTVSVTVGSDGKGSGDVNTSTSNTDLGGSWAALKKAASDDKTGLLTGGAKIMQDKTEVCGMTLSDGDFATIAAMAEDIDRWKKVEQNPNVYSAWIRTRLVVVGANGDRQKIARALAEYGARNDGATHAIERIVRGVGSADGGALYDWPGELSTEKSSYSSLITGDPLATVKVQEKAGNNAVALESAKGALAKIDALITAMQTKQDKFSNAAALGEMLAAAAAQRGQVAKEIAVLSHRLGGVNAGNVELTASNVTAVPTAEQAAQMDINQAAAKGELTGYASALGVFERKQREAFEYVQREQAKETAVFASPDTEGIVKALNNLHDNVYPDWEKTLVQARDAATRGGLDPWSVQPTPGKGFFNVLFKHNFGREVYEWPPKPKAE